MNPTYYLDEVFFTMGTGLYSVPIGFYEYLLMLLDYGDE